ncbi:hypothetical protein [Mariniblastus fucicola]|uniref:Uncharacterized protein n=1 Tax=Mariniblastus fucicola TaxID=980251 RepID=A0A5B9P9N9_9BACT|nr:hypothetical protein [Mariniblastus fucicola]QEG23038.1 hypothetical protein MFFC18_29300 [Mariniblastus fucicola]
MFRTTFFAVIAAISICQSAEAQQANPYDTMFDYKIQIRQRDEYGVAVYYDTHAPISNPWHQVNQKWRAFQSTADGDAFFAANPAYEVLQSRSCWIDESDWMEVDEVSTYNGAEVRAEELRQKNNYKIETQIIPVYKPMIMNSSFSQNFRP